jgi:alpha-1,6-mannosyltransferase
MAKNSSAGDASLVLSASSAQSDTTVALPRLAPVGRRLSLPRLRLAASPYAAWLALAMLIGSSLAVVLFSTNRESALVPRSAVAFPGWMAGPLHGLFSGLTNNMRTLELVLSIVLGAMMVAYLIVLWSIESVSLRLLWCCVIALLAIMLMSPPLQLTDLFNYLGYARLGGLHGLNPYTHVIQDASYDPIYRFATWHNLTSPYGELFTALTYPLAWLPLPVAYWVLKVATVLTAGGFVWVVSKCARQLGRDPRFAIAFVALNPVFLIYAIGGFHNDFFMLLPSTAAISLVLAKRDRSAGVVLMLAVGIKFTAILLLPFLLIAVRPNARRIRLLSGAVIAAIPLVIGSLVLFGFSLPNLSDQSTLLTNFSIPNVVGLLLKVGGGTPGLLKVANVLLVVTVAYLIWRRRDWLTSAGWATLALIASLAWLMPWYAVWLLPLAALGTSFRLRVAAIGLTVFLLVTFLPEVSLYMIDHHISPLRSPAGQSSLAQVKRLEANP